MGRKLHFKLGSFYRTDDRSGFPQRAENTREEWTGLIVDEALWEPRNTQDFVKGVKDYQGVPKPRPLPPNIFDGPIYTALTANAAIGATVLTVESVAGFTNGDSMGVMLNNGEVFRTTVSGAPSGASITMAAGLPFPAASGNDVIDYAVHIPPLPYANLSTG
jgi:hypothetical protein